MRDNLQLASADAAGRNMNPHLRALNQQIATAEKFVEKHIDVRRERGGRERQSLAGGGKGNANAGPMKRKRGRKCYASVDARRGS